MSEKKRNSNPKISDKLKELDMFAKMKSIGNKTSEWIKLKFGNNDINEENIEQYQSTGFHTKPQSTIQLLSPQSYSDLFEALDIPKINGNNRNTYYVPIQKKAI